MPGVLICATIIGDDGLERSERMCGMTMLAPRISQRNGRLGPNGPARLAGAAGLVLTAWGALTMALPLLPFDVRGPLLLPVTLGAALWCGWRICGAVADGGAVALVARGLRAAFWLMFWGLAFMGLSAMLPRAARGFYRDPFEAVLDIAPQALALAGRLSRPDIVATLFLGGVLSAMVAQWVGRRWR